MEIFIQPNSINVLIPRTPQMRLLYPKMSDLSWSQNSTS